MSTQMEPPAAAIEAIGPAPATIPADLTVDADQVVEIQGIGWADYKAVARLRQGRSRPKMIYIDGDLILVSPGQPHERLNIRVGRFFYEIIANLRIPTLSLGQTTWRRRRKDAALEGDQTFYIANEPLVRGRKVDLRVDPPPDLAIEVVYSHKATRALEVYQRLGVPEVWICEENRTAILVRQEDGEYKEVDRSLCLPLLSAAEIYAQTQQPEGMAELDWIDGLRRWVREVLLPQVPHA